MTKFSWLQSRGRRTGQGFSFATGLVIAYRTLSDTRRTFRVCSAAGAGAATAACDGGCGRASDSAGGPSDMTIMLVQRVDVSLDERVSDEAEEIAGSVRLGVVRLLDAASPGQSSIHPSHFQRRSITADASGSPPARLRELEIRELDA